jgi:hypothetical protein
MLHYCHRNLMVRFSEQFRVQLQKAEFLILQRHVPYLKSISKSRVLCDIV